MTLVPYAVRSPLAARRSGAGLWGPASDGDGGSGGAKPPGLILMRGRLIEAHPEAQAHPGQDLRGLVQRLSAEVLRLQHLPFGLLHQLANRPDVRVLQAVVGADRQLELLDALVEVLVERGARLVGRGVLQRLADILEVDEDVQ